MQRSSTRGTSNFAVPSMRRASTAERLRRRFDRMLTFKNQDKVNLPLQDDELDVVWQRSRRTKLYRSLLKEIISQQAYVVTVNGWPAEAASEGDAIDAFEPELRSVMGGTVDPQFIVIFCSEALNADALMDAVALRFPNTVAVQGSTTCTGVSSGQGFHSLPQETGAPPLALALWAVFDPLGAYSTCALPETPSRAQRQSKRLSGKSSASSFRQSIASNGSFEEPQDWDVCDDEGTPVQDVEAETSKEAYFVILDEGYQRLREQVLPSLLRKNWTIGDLHEPLAEYLRIWLNSMPGMEETILAVLDEWGLSRFDLSIPVVGGSAADATIGGQWFVFGQGMQASNRSRFGGKEPRGAMLTLMAPAMQVHTLFMHPFTPRNEFRATVTGCGNSPTGTEGKGRVIFSLTGQDGKTVPAGTQYHRWCEDHIQQHLMPPPETAPGDDAFNPAVLKASTFCPLGVSVANEGDEAFDYQLLHPSGIYFHPGDVEQSEALGNPDSANGAYLKAFAGVKEGTELVLMQAQRGDLLHRVAKMKEQLVTQLDKSGGETLQAGAASAGASPEALHERIAGALMVYCAGCMMGINNGTGGAEQMRRLSAELTDVFGGRPFAAMHPFGEQGFYPSKRKNGHGNLMFSALVFTRDPCYELDESCSFAESLEDMLAVSQVRWGRQTSGDSQSESKTSDAIGLLRQLLRLGHQANWWDLSLVVDAGAISTELLKDLTVCSSQPLNFAIHVARMLHQLAQRRPLRAKLYRKNASWFAALGRELLDGAALRQISVSGMLTDKTMVRVVRWAEEIHGKDIVATHIFQDVVEWLWQSGGTADAVLEALVRQQVEEGDGAGEETGWLPTWSPRVRHYTNAIAYMGLWFLHFLTSVLWRRSTLAWLLVLVWAFAHMVRSLAAAESGFYKRGTNLNDVAIVAALTYMCVSVSYGEEVAQDVDSALMLMHAYNALKFLQINAKLGPIIILVQKSAKDMTWLLSVTFIFILTFMASFHALFQNTTMSLEPSSADSAGLAAALTWGPEMMFEMEKGQHNTREGGDLLYSTITGLDHETALRHTGLVLCVVLVVILPVLMLNLLIATLASSYAQVERDADVEWKLVRASAVIVARELPALPIPLSLPQDLVRLVRKWWQHQPQSDVTRNRTTGCDAALFTGAQAPSASISQAVAHYEARRSLERLGSLATAGEVERLRRQGEGVLERVNVLHLAMKAEKDKMN